ncbi:hypothetical protein ACFQV2_00010 [Actinokineospora soli]|uniref:AAA+ ATPase domain-containing protein n=1 Tax=Actinokineospora soli TaxID=1048753 RepID=A0ABW2TEW0_9PSEU
MVAALKPGAFVLLVGDSAAGKSRLAFEATREVLGKHRLFVPEPQALAAVINEAATERRALLWLDDLERFLTGDNSLNVTMLDRLLNHPDKHRRVVIATLRLQEQHLLDSTPTPTVGSTRTAAASWPWPHASTSSAHSPQPNSIVHNTATRTLASPKPSPTPTITASPSTSPQDPNSYAAGTTAAPPPPTREAPH